MKQLLAFGYIGLVCLCSCLSLRAQPGMYVESDIEYQTLFFDALEAKYKGDTDSQIELLNTIIKRDKNSHAAYHELAKTYMITGNMELAQKNAAKATALEPNNEWYHKLLAEIYELTDQNTPAVTTYQKILSLNSDNANIYHKLAQLQLKNNDIAGAVSNLELLQERQGVDEETSRRIFDIHKTAGNDKAAVATLQKLITAFPDNTRYMGNLASYYQEIGKEKKAIAVYEDILKIDPTDSKALVITTKSQVAGDKDQKLSVVNTLINNTNLSLDEKIQELMPYVATMQSAGQTTEELDKISSQLVSSYPKEAKVYALRADILFYQGKFEDAATNYAKGLELDDSKYALWSQYLQTLWELERYSDLTDISEEALDLYPNKVQPFLYHSLGLSQTTKANTADFIMEAGFIAGKSDILKTKISLVDLWLNKTSTNKDAVSQLDLRTLEEPLYLELAGDLYAAINDSAMAKKLWEQAIKLGANATRINAKSNLE